MDTLEQAQKIFSGDVFATGTVGIRLTDAHAGYAKCVLEVNEKHLNANGVVMGGAIFTLADFAFAVASNFEELNTASLSSQITYLSAAKCSVLTAEAKRVKEGRSTCYYVIDITDEGGKAIAQVTTTGFIVRHN